MFSGVDRIPTCDRRTDGQTSCDSIVRAMHMRRAIIMHAVFLETLDLDRFPIHKNDF